MSIEVASLHAVISLVDNLTPGLRGAEGSLDGFSGRLQRIGGNIAGFGARLSLITAPIAALGGVAINTASNFDSAMAEISARTGLVGEDLEQIRTLAIQMGADTAFSAQESAEAFLELLSSGQSAEEAIATLPFILDAAAASGESLGTTADTVTDIMASFGLGIEDTEMVVNALAQAAGASSADMASLGQGFGNVGGIARQFGVSVEDTAAVLAIFAENGIKGSEAGTQLRSMLNNMTRDTDAVNGMWNRLGISMYDTMGNVRPLEDVMNDLTAAMDGMSEQERIDVLQTLGGSYGQLGLAALTSSMSIGEMRDRMDEQAAASDVADARMDTFAGRMDSLRGSIETLMIEAVTPFMNEALKPLLEEATRVVNSITEWVQANPELASTIAVVMAGLVALGPILAVVGGGIGAIGAVIGFVLSPIGLVVAAVAGLAAAYHTNFLGIRDFIDNEVRPRLEQFFNFLGDVWEQVQPALENLYNWFVEEALPAIQAFITNTVQPAVEDFFNIIAGAWQVIRYGLGQLYDWFVVNGLPIVQQAVDNVRTGIQAFQDLAAALWDFIRPRLQPIVEWFQNTFQRVQEFVQPVIDTIQSVIDRAEEALQFLRDLGIISGGSTVQPTTINIVTPSANSTAISSSGGIGGTRNAPSGSNAGQTNNNRIEIGTVNVQANSRAEGAAAADGFAERLEELRRRQG